MNRMTDAFIHSLKAVFKLGLSDHPSDILTTRNGIIIYGNYRSFHYYGNGLIYLYLLYRIPSILLGETLLHLEMSSILRSETIYKLQVLPLPLQKMKEESMRNQREKKKQEKQDQARLNQIRMEQHVREKKMKQEREQKQQDQELEDQKRQQFLQALTLRQKQRMQQRLQKQQVMLANQQQQDVQQIYGN